MSDAAPPTWVTLGLEAIELHSQSVAKRREADGWPRWHRRRRSLMRESRSLSDAFMAKTEEMDRAREAPLAPAR